MGAACAKGVDDEATQQANMANREDNASTINALWTKLDTNDDGNITVDEVRLTLRENISRRVDRPVFHNYADCKRATVLVCVIIVAGEMD